MFLSIKMFNYKREKIKMESIKKLSNFNFQWTKTLYQNNLKNICIPFYIFQGLNNTKENF